jgi:excisionase family DNA binding protein
LRNIPFENADVQDEEVMDVQANREWLRVPEAAELLGLPRTRTYELIQQGELPAVRIGERSIRVNRRELERFLLETRRVVD